VKLAARGVRDLDNGEEAIEDSAVVRQLQKQARKVQMEAVGMGLGLTALAFILPRARAKR
jgi:hypothetical protein